MTCIDTFEGSHENRGASELGTLEETFDNNMRRFGGKVTKLVGRSGDVLRRYARSVKADTIIRTDVMAKTGSRMFEHGLREQCEHCPSRTGLRQAIDPRMSIA